MRLMGGWSWEDYCLLPEYHRQVLLKMYEEERVEHERHTAHQAALAEIRAEMARKKR